MNEVLRIKNLNVFFDIGSGAVHAVRGISLTVNEGEVLALVGESGCGKSAAARSVLRLNDSFGARTTAEELILSGHDVMNAEEKELLQIRKNMAGMIFQDPLTYLNPTMKVGRQITETLRLQGKGMKDCREEAIRLLEMVQIPQAAIRASQYPHQFSGGMRQRAMIAMALAAEPKLLIADEPTTALDPTVQRQILTLIKEIQKKHSMAVLLITHDLSVVAHVADKVAVMYAGEIIETSSSRRLFEQPAHPYTAGLLKSLPSKDREKPLFAIKGLPPDLQKKGQGCAFAPRCSSCMKICLSQKPENMEAAKGHWVSCWLWHRDCPKGGIGSWNHY